jgi:hypothetical protein
MIETNEVVALKSERSFYDKAAWFTLITPFAAIAMAWVLLMPSASSSISRSEQDNFSQGVLLCALVVQFISFILGLSICYRINQHRRKLTIWIATLGVLTSLGLGALTLIGLGLSNLGSGC